MNPLLSVLIHKVAAEQEASLLERAGDKARSAGKKIKKELLSLGSGRVTRRELREIKKQLKEKKPQTEKEKQIERIAGPKWTKGQYTRGALLGAGMGTGGHLVGSAITGRKMRDPRGILASSAVGAMYGAALPAARRLADIEAAKAGVY